MASDKTSQLFWLQYGDAIRNKVGAGGGDKIFFLASEAQKGPVAGTYVPDAYTCQGVYNIANNLLSTNNVYYSPSAQHGYDQALDNYLNWVDLEGKSNPALDSALLDAINDQKGCTAALERETDNALAKWEKQKQRGMTDKSFPYWLQSGNAPSYQAAKQADDQMSSKIINLQLQMQGAMSGAVKQDRDALRLGRDQNTDFPGYNMQAASGNPLSTAELIRKQNLGEKVPDPPTYRVPLYNADGYKSFIQDAMQKYSSSDYTSAQRIEVSIDAGKSTSDYNFGQTQGGGSVAAGTPWFSFSANASHSSESSSLQTGSEASQVKVAITYNDIRAVTITPGQWNVDVSKYKLRSDAPKSVKTLARVSQVIVIAGLGYEITVGDSTASSLDAKLKETTSAGGSISVFGIPINLGGSGSSTTEKNSHSTTWDKASKTFKVVPNFDNNTATIVGVVAEPFNIKQ